MNLSLPVKFALVSFVVTLFGVVGVAMMAYQESDQLLQQEAAKSLSLQVIQEADKLESKAVLIKNDVSYLASSEPVQLLAKHYASKVSSGSGVLNQEVFALGRVESLCADVLVQREMY